MPLRLEGSPKPKANIHFSCATSIWTINFKSYGVLTAVNKTHNGLPVFRFVFETPMEIVPGQEVKICYED